MADKSSSQGDQGTLRHALDEIVRIDETFSTSVKKLKVINLASWRTLKSKRRERIESLARRGYK